VRAQWRVDPEEIAETWWDNASRLYRGSEAKGREYRESVKAHLALGMGVAAPVEAIHSCIAKLRGMRGR